EHAERAVVACELALALEDVDLDAGLPVGGGGEGLLLARRDGGVLLDELGHDAAEGLDAEAEGRDVEEEDVLDLALEDAALDGGAEGDDLVGVDGLVGLLAEDLLADRLDLGHGGGAADEDDLVDLGGIELGVAQRGAAGLVEAL